MAIPAFKHDFWPNGCAWEKPVEMTTEPQEPVETIPDPPTETPMPEQQPEPLVESTTMPVPMLWIIVGFCLWVGIIWGIVKFIRWVL